ncbi:MAG: nucleoside/nucleotide kinase family protein [Pseudomonadota bacterium]|nr:nucleoside/nucleotide kinase family protein [Pseudomonadota bacterium]
MAPTPIDLRGLAGLLTARAHGKRVVMAIAGAPGSGKSTFANELAMLLNAGSRGSASVLPMDGFHYDDMLLDSLGRRARKGAPDTFDVAGFRNLLGRLRENCEDAIAVPVFDRAIEISRGGARLIAREISIIIVEGNYLLLRQPPWSQLKPMFDVTVMVETGVDTLRRRLTERWQGFDLPADEIRRKVEENDLPNGLFVAAESADADYRLAN